MKVKRFLGMLLAGAVGIGTLFSGTALAKAEDNVISETIENENLQTNTQATETTDAGSKYVISTDTDDNGTEEESFEEAAEENDGVADDNESQSSSEFQTDSGKETDEEKEYSEKVLSSYSGQNADITIDESNFPDENFRKYISDKIDKNSDGILSEDEIKECRDIRIGGLGVHNLEGIKYFTSLRELSSWQSTDQSTDTRNSFDNIDVSGLSSLESLNFINCSVENLNVSGCTSLKYLVGGSVKSSLDLSGCNSLEILQFYYYGPELSSLDLSSCPKLEELTIYSTNIKSLDLRNCPQLKSLNLSYTGIGYDFFGDPRSGPISSLDLSNCVYLESLICSNNSISNLDLSNCKSLKILKCQGNKLNNLDISNCPLLEYLCCADNEINSLDLSVQSNLTYLNCGLNNLYRLDLNNCPKLEGIECYGNNLSSMDIRNFQNLILLCCDSNDLNSLSVSNCPKLTALFCVNNNLDDLDISNLPGLKYLNCSKNDLSGLSISNCPKLIFLSAAENELSSLESVKCSGILILSVSNNDISELDLNVYENVKYLCADAQLVENLDLNDESAIEGLRITNVSSVDKKVDLKSLLPALDVSKYEYFRFWENIDDGVVQLREARIEHVDNKTYTYLAADTGGEHADNLNTYATWDDYDSYYGYENTFFKGYNDDIEKSHHQNYEQNDEQESLYGMELYSKYYISGYPIGASDGLVYPIDYTFFEIVNQNLKNQKYERRFLCQYDKEFYWSEAVHYQKSEGTDLNIAIGMPEETESISDPDPVPLTSFMLIKPLSILMQQTSHIYASFSPTNATNKKLTWKSEDPSIATVDSHGNVTGISPGTTTITATAEDGGFTDYCNVTVLADSDGDGLPDLWEINGVDFDGDGIIDLPLNEMGADPNKPDIFVEVDWMSNKPAEYDHFLFWDRLVSEEITFKPRDVSLWLVYYQFKEHDINLHIDAGPESVDYVTGKKWGPLSGGNELPYEETLQLGSDFTKWNDIATNHFTKERWNSFRYCIFCNRYDYGKGSESSGIASDIPGQFFIVASREGDFNTPGRVDQAGTFMHELGHTLGLAHGGILSDGTKDLETLYKPNYLSIMNYYYQLNGLFPTNELNYGEVSLPDIDEKHLNEFQGFDPYIYTWGTGLGAKWGSTEDVKTVENIAGKRIDFNQNGIDDEEDIEYDLNGDGELSEFKSTENDWDHLEYMGGLIGKGIDTIDRLVFKDDNTVEIQELDISTVLSSPGTVKASNISPMDLYKEASQFITLTLSNLHNSNTVSRIKVSSDLLSADYTDDIVFEPNEDIQVTLTLNDNLQEGTYVVKTTIECENGATASYEHKVNVKNIPQIELKPGSSYKLSSNVSGEKISWTSKQETVASVENDNIIALHEGETLILGTLESGELLPLKVKVAEEISAQPSEELFEPVAESTTEPSEEPIETPTYPTENPTTSSQEPTLPNGDPTESGDETTTPSEEAIKPTEAPGNSDEDSTEANTDETKPTGEATKEEPAADNVKDIEKQTDDKTSPEAAAKSDNDQSNSPTVSNTPVKQDNSASDSSSGKVSKATDTGDKQLTPLWISIASAIAGVMIISIVIYNRKKKDF